MKNAGDILVVEVASYMNWFYTNMGMKIHEKLEKKCNKSDIYVVDSELRIIEERGVS